MVGHLAFVSLMCLTVLMSKWHDMMPKFIQGINSVMNVSNERVKGEHLQRIGHCGGCRCGGGAYLEPIFQESLYSVHIGMVYGPGFISLFGHPE